MARAKAQVINHLPKPEGTRYRFGKLTFLTEQARAEYLEWKFWTKVAPRVGEGACWEWLGTLQPSGCGLIQLMARYAPGQISADGDRLVSISAHRYSYFLHHGPIPEGQDVAQTCGKKDCVNPEHLVARARDMAGSRAGRGQRGPLAGLIGLEVADPVGKAERARGVWAAST